MSHASPNASRSIQFGRFRLDAAARVLYRDGEPVPLTLKQVQTLAVLVREAGEVVDRDRLMREVWPDTFVEDGGLTRNISAIRKALGDGVDGAAFIETVPKRGYRFVAPVSVESTAPFAGMALPSASLAGVPPAQATPLETVPGPGSTPRPRREARLDARVRRVAAVALLTLAAAAASWWAIRPRPPRATGSVPASFAILPFRPLSTDQRDQYVAYGLADLLTTRLGSLQSVRVRPVTTSVASPASDPIETGRRLGVDAVIDGTLRRLGDRLRLTVQVIEVSTGAPLYTGTFDERGDDLLALESALADGVLSLLVPRLRDPEQSGRARAGTASERALEQYLLGRYLLATRQPDRVEEAIAAFEASRAADSAFALAFASLAHAYIVQGGYQYRRPADVFPKARLAALRALDLDPLLAEAHGALGEVWQHDWNWAAAEKAFDRAVELAPHEPLFRQWRAFYLAGMGRGDEALDEIERAAPLAPRDFSINLVRVALYYWTHRFEDVAIHADRAAELGGYSLMPLLYKHFALYRLGRFDEARALFESIRPLAPDDPMLVAIAALYDGRDGRPGDALARLADLEARRHQGRYVDAFILASAYLDVGREALAFQWLEQAVEDRSTLVRMLAVDPFWTHLHGDPRFLRLIEHVGLGPSLTRVSGRRAGQAAERATIEPRRPATP